MLITIRSGHTHEFEWFSSSTFTKITIKSKSSINIIVDAKRQELFQVGFSYTSKINFKIKRGQLVVAAVHYL